MNLAGILHSVQLLPLKYLFFKSYMNDDCIYLHNSHNVIS